MSLRDTNFFDAEMNVVHNFLSCLGQRQKRDKPYQVTIIFEGICQKDMSKRLILHTFDHGVADNVTRLSLTSLVAHDCRGLSRFL